MGIIKSLIIQSTLIIFFCNISIAQDTSCDAADLEGFFECYGGVESFNSHSVDAVTAFIQAEDAISEGDFARAKTLIENVFNNYPKGDNQWWSVINDPNEANIGAPHAYYGLRMMEDIVDYYLSDDQEVEARTAYMKVVLVGCSEGVQPTNEIELQNGTGPFVTNDLAEELKEDNYRIIHQSLGFFSTYVTAITKGQLELEIEVIELPDVCMQVSVSTGQPPFATGSIDPVWEALTEEVKDSTDWWWILYPSHVPEFSTFDDEAFITGGMGSDAKGGPAFIIDDKWIVRKPAHLGKGKYSDIERRIYLPQWLQHEFFHHLYRVFPELSLEVNGHDWFDRNFWATDFEGQFEPDYYAETLHKRLQVDCVPLVNKLITRVDDQLDDQFGRLSMDELLGRFSLENVQNDWHIGELIKEGSSYYWRNNANVQWSVFPNLAEGRLETGSDSPYPGKDFFLQLYQNADGSYAPGVIALKYQGEEYRRRFDLIRDVLPMAAAIGAYERTTDDNKLQTGEIIKDAGQFYWVNDDGDKWLLTPNPKGESFELNNDSPTPSEFFELEISENECEIYVSGFYYLDVF